MGLPSVKTDPTNPGQAGTQPCLWVLICPCVFLEQICAVFSCKEHPGGVSGHAMWIDASLAFGGKTQGEQELLILRGICNWKQGKFAILCQL